MWWLFVTLGIAAISAVEYFVDREHRDDARAANRRSKEALDRLDRSQRRQVSQAVRGQAVVPSGTRGWRQPPSPWRRWSRTALLPRTPRVALLRSVT